MALLPAKLCCADSGLDPRGMWVDLGFDLSGKPVAHNSGLLSLNSLLWSIGAHYLELLLMIQSLRDPIHTILPYLLGIWYILIYKVMRDFYHQQYLAFYVVPSCQPRRSRWICPAFPQLLQVSSTQGSGPGLSESPCGLGHLTRWQARLPSL